MRNIELGGLSHSTPIQSKAPVEWAIVFLRQAVAPTKNKAGRALRIMLLASNRYFSKLVNITPLRRERCQHNGTRM